MRRQMVALAEYEWLGQIFQQSTELPHTTNPSALGPTCRGYGVKSGRRSTGNMENVFVVIDYWSMSFGIEMLPKSALVAKRTTKIIAPNRLYIRLFKPAHHE